MEHLIALGTAVVPLIIGTVSQPLAELIFKVNAAIDKLPALVKRIVVIVIAYGLGFVASFLDVVLPESLALFESGHVMAALSAAFAMIIHQASK